MTKTIKNRKQGHHFNSKHWQTFKTTLSPLPPTVFQTAFGMVLGDATMYHVSREAYIKFEQGINQKPFLDHLFDVFRDYCFMVEPQKRLNRDQTVKSYWFKTFSFSDFTRLYSLFYQKTEKKRRKCIRSGLVLHHLTPLGLAYWIMCDGSLQKDGKTLVLHTQGFHYSENVILSCELNKKFGFSSRVIPHKHKYYVIEIPKQDSRLVFHHVSQHMIPSMRYKIEKDSSR